MTVAAWDCGTYPYPIQILKGASDSNYRTMQLNVATGAWSEMWQWTTDTTKHPTTQLNSQAYNVNDGIAYGLFSTSASASWNVAPAYLCRFSHEQNSAICLCKAPYWGYSATITRDGTYYLARQGGARIHKLADTQNIAFPDNSPVAVSSLPSCGMTQVLGGMGTGGYIDVSNSGLNSTVMEAAYDITSSCTSNCYMQVWTKTGTTMMRWTPGAQSFAE